MAIMSIEELNRRLQGVQDPLRSIVIQIYNDSGGRIGVTGRGGFRDRATQEEMYQDYLNGGNLAAKPGHSMHERGLAVDFAVEGDDYDLLAQYAGRYGLVNSVDGEPWHYTMGDDVKMEGVDTGNMVYEVGETENPEDALANRLNAVFSIIGGSGPVGPEPQFDDGIFTQLTAQQQAGVSDVAAGAGAGVMAGDKGALQQYALSKFGQYGWDQGELNALIELWMRESGWNPQADNPTSSAAGIAQKMTSIHGALEPTPQGQIDWGLEYIVDRYGSPSAALNFHNRNNWY